MEPIQGRIAVHQDGSYGVDQPLAVPGTKLIAQVNSEFGVAAPCPGCQLQRYDHVVYQLVESADRQHFGKKSSSRPFEQSGTIRSGIEQNHAANTLRCEQRDARSDHSTPGSSEQYHWLVNARCIQHLESRLGTLIHREPAIWPLALTVTGRIDDQGAKTRCSQSGNLETPHPVICEKARPEQRDIFVVTALIVYIYIA